MLVGVNGCRSSSVPDPYAVRPVHGTGWVASDHYVGPLPWQRPQLTRGQQFLCLTDSYSSEMPQFRDTATRQNIAIVKMGLRVFILRKIDPNPVPGAPALLTFSIEGSSHKLTLASDAGVDNLPCLTPLSEDGRLDSLRQRYEGHLVWCYGGCGTQHTGGVTAVTDDAQTSVSVITPVLLPVRIRRIVRLCALSRIVRYGAYYPSGSQDPKEPGFMDDRPLLIVLDSPNARYGGTNFQYHTTADAKRHLLGTYALCADPDDFKQNFSLRSPRGEHPGWPQAVLQEIADGDAQVGMTHDAVAWTLGWPSYFEAPKEQRAESNWRYDNGCYGYTLSFDQRGRVSYIDEGIPP